MERAPQKVLDDVLDGFCSPGHARDIYVVIIDLEAETVDRAGTSSRRKELAGAR